MPQAGPLRRIHRHCARECRYAGSADQGENRRYDSVRTRYALTVDAAEFVTALPVALTAAAQESSRYAIDGVLLEADDHGARLVATDGRRMVVTELRQCQGDFRGQVILSRRLLQLAERLTGRDADHLVVSIARPKASKDTDPAGQVFVAGPDWLLSTHECEGSFPRYRDVLPESHSRFAIGRAALIETLTEVSLATTLDRKAVGVDLYADRVGLSADAPGVGTAEAQLAAEFLGGGDSEIHTGFNPAFLLDALRTLPGEHIILDVAQNIFGCDRSVIGRPALLYTEHDPLTRWIVMPVNAALPVTRANLGSNYPEDLEGEELADAG